MRYFKWLTVGKYSLGLTGTIMSAVSLTRQDFGKFSVDAIK